MVSDELLNEVLKNALAGQAQEFRLAPEEVEAEKARLQALGREQAAAAAATPSVEAPEVAGPTASRVPMTQKVVDLRGQPLDDVELAFARAQDRKARQREAFERGSRELVAGITRTEVQPIIKQAQDAEARLLAKRREADALRLQDNAQRLQAARFDYETKSAAQRAAEAKALRQENLTREERIRQENIAREEKRRQEDLEERRIDNQRAERFGLANLAATQAGLGLRKGEAEEKAKKAAQEAAAGEMPLFGQRFTATPGLSDSERSKAREITGLWNAADTATGELEKAMQAYVMKPGPTTAAMVRATLAGAQTSLNAAFGQGAMAEAEAARMTETLGADLFSPAGVAAVFESIQGDSKAGALLLTKLRTARQANRAAAKGRLSAYGTVAGGAAPKAEGGAPKVEAGADEKVVGGKVLVKRDGKWVLK